VHFPLSSAYLCAELACSAVSDDPRVCPACGNTHLVSVQRLIDRDFHQYKEYNGVVEACDSHTSHAVRSVNANPIS
jgi:hypothetical protein